MVNRQKILTPATHIRQKWYILPETRQFLKTYSTYLIFCLQFLCVWSRLEVVDPSDPRGLLYHLSNLYTEKQHNLDP